MLREIDFPGLARVYRNDGSIELVWVASPAAIAAGFTPEIVRLHCPDWSQELAERCQDLEAEMRARPDDHGQADKPIVFDGTMGGLIEIYQMHPESTYHQLRENTRWTYYYNMQKLSHAVGGRRLSQLNDIDLRRWYRMFKQPKHGDGRDRISGAHDLMSMLRTVLSFGSELGLPHARRLRAALSAIKFPDAPARSGRP